MSSATLPNTLPAPTTAIFATNKSPIRSAGLVVFPLYAGSDVATFLSNGQSFDLTRVIRLGGWGWNGMKPMLAGA